MLQTGGVQGIGGVHGTGDVRRDAVTARRPSELQNESRALLASMVFLIVGVVVGTLVFWNHVWPLFGADSVGAVAAIVGAVSAAVTFPVAYWPSITRKDGSGPPDAPPLSRIKRIFDTVGLAACHGAIILLAILAAFTLMERAFDGVQLDVLAGSICVGVAGAVSAYFTYLSGAKISASSLATVFVIFFVSGAVASMLATDNRQWFEINLSALGITPGIAGITFNLTAILSGVIMMVLADYLVNDIDIVFRRRRDYRLWRTRVIRWSFVAIGVSLVVVGLVPVSASLVIHNIAANSLTIIFAGLLVFNRQIVPGFSPMFYLAGWILLASMVAGAVLFFPVAYYNLTSFEMLAGALIFCWVIIFVRNTSAALLESDLRG